MHWRIKKKNLLCPDLHEFNNLRWPHTYESESKIFTDPVKDKEGICLQDSFILEVLHVTQLCGCFFYKAIAPLGSIDLVWLNMSSERKWSMNHCFKTFSPAMESADFCNLEEADGKSWGEEVKIPNVSFIFFFSMSINENTSSRILFPRSLPLPVYVIITFCCCCCMRPKGAWDDLHQISGF